MTIFAVLLPVSQPALEDRIKAAFPADSLQLTETQWLISSGDTTIEVTARIGIADPQKLDVPAIGTGVVFATSSYYGRAPSPVWDWIKSKLEAVSSHG